MKILAIFGTRPEAIKMLPVVRGFYEKKYVEVKVCVTAQHRAMLDQVLSIYNVKPDYDLNVMLERQTVTQVTCGVIQKLEPILDEFKPDWVLVHGDTTTAFSASLAAFYKKVNVAHVEAGLRTNDIYSPWPEEINRQLISRIAKLHFAPTEEDRQNLLRESIQEDCVFVTGNTVVDALYAAIAYIKNDCDLERGLGERFGFIDPNKKLILVTCHRRENFGMKIEDICQAILNLANRKDLQIVYPVHPNPNIKEVVYRILSQKENIYLLPPLDYLSFVYVMSKSYLILTDSGGIQEEAPSLGKPVVVMREITERSESIRAGTAMLVDSNTGDILKAVITLLDSTDLYRKMANVDNPYGDGHAAERIIAKILANKQ